jgi:hypothetical protein
MEAINELRRLARERRDKEGSTPVTSQRLGSCVLAAIPSEPFTSADLIRALEVRQPKRSWHLRSVNGALARLRRKGIIRRLHSARPKAGRNGSEGAVYVRSDAALEAEPFANTCFRDVLFQVLGGRSLTLIELTVAVQEAGYRTAMKGPALQVYARQTLRSDSRFRKVGERWSC